MTSTFQSAGSLFDSKEFRSKPFVSYFNDGLAAHRFKGTHRSKAAVNLASSSNQKESGGSLSSKLGKDMKTS